MKYDVDFTKDKTVIFVGGEVDAVKAFMGIVHVMNNYRCMKIWIVTILIDTFLNNY